MKNIPYGRQEITDQDIESVVEVLKSDFLTQGPRIAEFEAAFASYVGSKYAVALSNGTAALHLAAMALGIEPGDRVITTPNTFAASANCIRYAGGEVKFVDIDPETFVIDLNKVEDLLRKSPNGEFKGIVPVAFAGYPLDLAGYRTLADKYRLWVLEDACHAPGASLVQEDGSIIKSGGGLADASIFSFHPVKHIATGEGGMITTNRKDVYDRLMVIRTHGITKNPNLLSTNHGGWYYEMIELGYNYRMTDMQAALGSSQLKRAGANLTIRRQIADRYNTAFKNRDLITPKVSTKAMHAYHLYVIQVEDRLGLYNHLKSLGIHVQVHYIPVHTFPYYIELGWKKGDFPIAEAYYEHCLSLPMYPTLTNDEQEFVIEAIKNFVKK